MEMVRRLRVGIEIFIKGQKGYFVNKQVPQKQTIISFRQINKNNLAMKIIYIFLIKGLRPK